MRYRWSSILFNVSHICVKRHTKKLASGSMRPLTMPLSPAYAVAIPRAALCSSYSLWLHWCSSAARTASRHRSRNASAPSQKHSRAKAPEPLAMHALSAKSYRLDDSRGQRLKRAWDKSIIDENEHVFVYMVRYMPAGAISFDIVLAGTFYFRMLSVRTSNSERTIAMLYEFK